MALRVWLPLNGSVENKGISGVGLIQKTAPTYVNNGKIGKALSAGAFTLSATDTASILNNEEISFCFWIYPNAETGDTVNRAMIFGNGGMTAPNNRKFSIFQYPTCNDLHLSWQNDVTNTTFLSGVWNGVFPSYIWTHCAITYSKAQGKATIYINGEQYSTANGVSNSPSFEFETYLMSNGGTFRYLNDYRIYDHCLSPKEVKEISQGLVLHYKLDGSNQVFNGVRNYLGNSRPYYTGYDFNDTNKLLRRNYNRNSSSGNPPFDQTYDAISDIVYENGDQFRRIIISSDRDNTTTNNYQIMHPWIYSGYEKYTNDGSFWSKIQLGDKISFSCYVRSNNYFLLKSVLRIFTSSSNYAYHFFTDGITYGVDAGNLNEWYKLSSTLTVTQELYNLISNWDGMTRFMLIMQFSQAPNVSIASENIVIDFKEYMLEFSDTPHDWMPAPEDFNIDETKVTDSSGYEHDGTIIGELSTESGLSRYSSATYIGSTSSKIHILNFPTSGFGNSYTFAWWAKISSVNPMHWGFSDGIRLNGMYTGRLWNTGDGSNNPLYIPGTTTQVSAPTVNVWHHWVMTGDGTSCKVYQDGVYWGVAKTYKSISGTSIYINGWNSNTDYSSNDLSISDFRIYATALSAEDVLDLYHASVNIDNENKLHTFELEETSENILSSSAFEQGGIVDANGTETEITTRLRTFYVPVMPNTSYKIFTNDNFQVRGVHFFTENKTWISWISFFAQTGQFTTPSNCYYIRIPFQKADSGANITLSDLDSMVPTLTAIIERTNGLSNKAYNVNIFKNGITRANNFSISPKSSIDKSGIIEAADFIEK